MLTNRNLLNTLLKMNESELDNNVTIYDTFDNEFIPDSRCYVMAENECALIDSGNLILVTNEVC